MTTVWNSEYLVPRFIADCARCAGYCAVIFNSAKHTDEDIVLSIWDDRDTPVREPALRLVERDERRAVGEP